MPTISSSQSRGTQHIGGCPRDVSGEPARVGGTQHIRVGGHSTSVAGHATPARCSVPPSLTRPRRDAVSPHLSPVHPQAIHSTGSIRTQSGHSVLQAGGSAGDTARAGGTREPGGHSTLVAGHATPARCSVPYLTPHQRDAVSRISCTVFKVQCPQPSIPRPRRDALSPGHPLNRKYPDTALWKLGAVPGDTARAGWK